MTYTTLVFLIAGELESLIYDTVTGEIGALVSLISGKNMKLYADLEGCLPIDAPRPTDREPQAYIYLIIHLSNISLMMMGMYVKCLDNCLVRQKRKFVKSLIPLL